MGHHNYSNTDQPFIYQDRVFGLNTDCVTGKALTGLLLPSFKFLSVPSRANYWVQVRRMCLEAEVLLLEEEWDETIKVAERRDV